MSAQALAVPRERGWMTDVGVAGNQLSAAAKSDEGVVGSEGLVDDREQRLGLLPYDGIPRVAVCCVSGVDLIGCHLRELGERQRHGNVGQRPAS